MRLQSVSSGDRLAAVSHMCPFGLDHASWQFFTDFSFRWVLSVFLWERVPIDAEID